MSDSSNNQSVTLKPTVEPTKAPTFDITQKPKRVCNLSNECEKFKDIIYFTKSDSFYLIDETVYDVITQAQETLTTRMSGSKQEGFMNALSEANLLDGLMSPDIEQFMSEEEKRTKQTAETWLKDNSDYGKWLENNADLKDWSQDSLVGNMNILSNSHSNRTIVQPTPVSMYHAQVKDQQKIIKTVTNSAIKKAELAGYVLDEGRLYTDREKEIQQCVAVYTTNKTKFIQFNMKDLLDTEKVKTQTPTKQIELLTEDILHINQFYKDVVAAPLTTGLSSRYVGAGYYLGMIFNKKAQESKLDEMKKAHLALVQSIFDLAKVGYATPEYALMLSHNEKSDLNAAYQDMLEYYSYIAREDNCQAILDQRMKDLLDASDQYAIPPITLFKADTDEIESLNEKAQAIKKQAEQAILDQNETFFLLWDAEFHPKPVEKLVKGHFSLREFILLTPQTSPDKNGPLRYLSLADLPLPPGVEEIVAPPTENSDVAFKKYCKSGIRRIEMKDKWFSDAGIFEPENFYADIKKHYDIESLRDGTDTSLWENAVSRIVFAKKLKERIAPFDSCVQTQLFRFGSVTYAAFGLGDAKAFNYASGELVDGSTNIGKTSLLSGSWGHKKETDESGKFGKTQTSKKLKATAQSVKADLTLARGEVNVLTALTGDPYLLFPETVEPEATMSLKVDDESVIQNDVGTITYSPGAMQGRLGIKAWGFAALSIASAQGIELSGKGFKFNDFIKHDAAKGETTYTTFKLEGNIGVNVDFYLDWYMPSGIPQFLVPQKARESQKLTLARCTLKASEGVSVDMPLIKYENGKFLIKLSAISWGFNAALEGEIEPEALGLWAWQFQCILRKANYKKVECVDDSAYEKLSQISKMSLLCQLNCGVYTARIKDEWDKIYSLYAYDRPLSIAYSLLEGDQEVLKHWIYAMTPEALGPILGTLAKDPCDSALSVRSVEIEFMKEQTYWMQKMAIALIVHYLAHPARDIKQQPNHDEHTECQIAESMKCMTLDRQAVKNLTNEQELFTLLNQYEMLTRFVGDTQYDGYDVPFAYRPAEVTVSSHNRSSLIKNACAQFNQNLQTIMGTTFLRIMTNQDDFITRANQQAWSANTKTTSLDKW